VKRLRLVASAVAAGVLLASAARAQPAAPAGEPRPARFALVSVAATTSPLEACGGSAALRTAVEERLHRAVFTDPDVADVVLRVETESALPGRSPAERPTWSAHIVEQDRAGTELGRRDVVIEAGDCGKGLETLAVVLAIMVGAERITTEAPVVVAPPPVAPPPEVPPTPPTPPSAPSDRPLAPPPSGWTASPVVELVFGTGILPDVAGGVQAGVFVRPPASRLSLAARAAYWPPRSTAVSGAAAIDRLGGALLGCFDILRPERAPSPTVALCAGADGGRLQSTSSVLTRASEDGAVLDVLAEGRVGYRFHAFGPMVLEPVIAVQIAAILRGDRFRYRDATGAERTLLEPAPAAFQASFGVVVHFL
jgi:hypothetical protein